tara:strand:- start:444 stop:665 length:222 start_codon:yes stop_codon:yes gene_type:complete
MSYKSDPNNSKKQVAKGITYGHQSFVGIFDTTAEITGLKAAKGSMAFSIGEGSHGALFIYTGTAWKKVAFAAG